MTQSHHLTDIQVNFRYESDPLSTIQEQVEHKRESTHKVQNEDKQIKETTEIKIPKFEIFLEFKFKIGNSKNNENGDDLESSFDKII